VVEVQYGECWTAGQHSMLSGYSADIVCHCGLMLFL
jgi:hypothetical protein